MLIFFFSCNVISFCVGAIFKMKMIKGYKKDRIIKITEEKIKATSQGCSHSRAADG